MICTQIITVGGRQLMRTYSDANKYIIRDGKQYVDAVDPIDSGRQYIEGAEIVDEDATEQDFIEALARLGVTA